MQLAFKVSMFTHQTGNALLSTSFRAVEKEQKVAAEVGELHYLRGHRTAHRWIPL